MGAVTDILIARPPAPPEASAKRRYGQAAPGFDLLTALGRTPDTSDPAVRWETASKLLASMFFKPLLAEMRKMPFGQKFAGGGRTEEIFGEQFDIRIADAVARSDPGGITSKLSAKLVRRANSSAVDRNAVQSAYATPSRMAESTLVSA